ncbi:MAG: UvrD-helicase domain-containing protein [Rhabdochlamydiaceae bacterium]|nr:UvrD-helicase domain-containing protein [Candidatus Amphrikana amoebophyrae]
MKTFNILSRNTQIPRHLFLEASAGTGKTFAIENLIIRQILDGVDCEEILVVTFTKAATRELKNRIANALNNAYDIIRTRKKGVIDYLDSLRVEDVKPALRKVRSALCQIEVMQILTLHGFCFRSLQRNAFEARQSFLDNEDESVVKEIKHLILDQFRTISEDKLHPIQFRILLKHHRNDFKALLDSIQRLIEFDIEVEEVNSFLESYAQFSDKLKVLDRDSLAHDLELSFSCYNKIKSRDGSLHIQFQSQYELILEVMTSGEISKEEFARLLGDKTFFLELMTNHNLKKSVKEFPKLLNRGAIEYIKEDLVPIVVRAKSANRILLYLVSQFHPSIIEHIQGHKGAFPDALLHQMDKALNESAFMKQMSDQYKVVIVDEFQDTDPVQWSILKKICLIDHPNLALLALIGDPKQSIYSFRNADLFTYMEARRHLDDDAHYILGTNYRSESKLMEALNLFFSSQLTFEESGESLSYIPVLAAKENSTWDQKHFQLFIAQEDKGRSKSWPTIEVEEKLLFPHIAQNIVDLNLKGHLFSDMAILIKDRFQGARLQSYLEKWSIPSISIRKSALAKCEMYHFILLFLKALESPYNESTLARFISHRFIGATHLLDRWQCHVVRLKKIFLEKGISAVFDKLFEIEEGALIKNVMNGKKLDHYGDLMTLVAFLLKQYRKLGSTLTEMILSLENLRLLNPDQYHEAKREVIQGFDAVNVMTTYMSKGLEFDFVFALGVSSRNNISDSIVSIKKQEGGILLKESNLSDNDVFEKQLGLDEEKLRQLYVALTRPKIALFLYTSLDTSRSKADVRTYSPLELFFHKRALNQNSYRNISSTSIQLDQIQPFLDELTQQVSFQYHLLSESIQIKELKSNSVNILPQRNLFQVNYERLRFISFSQLTTNDPVHSIARSGEEENRLPAGPQVGTIIHDIFDRVFDQGLYAPYNDGKIAKLINEMCEVSPLEGFEHQIETMIQQVFHIPLMPNFALFDLEPTDVWQEIEFSYQVDHTSLMKGFADLIFRVEGKIYLLDWKSNNLGNNEECYGEENCKKAMEDHQYFLQAAIYSEALKKMIKLHTSEPFETIFGGAFYIFLRGLEFNRGIYHFMPDLSLIEKKLIQDRK